MAFTLAHPAAILPLRNLSWLALLPMIVGSMTPDLVGFLPYRWEARLPHSHSPIGTVLIDLPLGYLVLLSVKLFRTALLQPLWQPHRRFIGAAIDAYFNRPRAALIALPSLLIGSWTHIVWDRFTHDTYWTHRNMPWLYQPLFPDATHELPIFHFLQYSTSLIGLVLLIWCYWRELQLEVAKGLVFPDASARSKWPLAGVVGVAFIAGVIRWMADDFSHDSIYSRISLVLKTAIIVFAVLYLLCGLVLSRNGMSGATQPSQST